jgi:hypothetical protein
MEASIGPSLGCDDDSYDETLAETNIDTQAAVPNWPGLA